MEQTELERYARQIALDGFGTEGQRRVGSSSVLVVGLGGLGAPVCLYLAGAGVGRIGLCDCDTVSRSNLQRQILYSVPDEGRAKVSAAQERLQALSPATLFDLFPEGLTAAGARETISGYDLVIDCCDNFSTRYLIDDTCRALRKPWVYGSIGELSGQTAIMGGKRGASYTALYPERERLCGRGPAKAVLGPVAGVLGAMQATAALQWLAGMACPLDGHLLTIDFSTFQTNLIAL